MAPNNTETPAGFVDKPKLANPLDTQDIQGTVIAETRDELSNEEMQLTGDNLKEIGVLRSTALKLAKKTLEISDPFKFEDFKAKIEKYQKDHNIGVDGKIGKETFLEMKASEINEKILNLDPKKGIDKNLQEDILLVFREGNINGLNVIKTGYEVAKFKEGHINEEKYKLFFSQLDSILLKRVVNPLLEQDEKDKKDNSNGNSILGEGGVLSLIKGEITAKEFWKNNENSIMTLSFGVIIFSVIFGVPPSLYENIPGGKDFYTRIPLLIGFLAIGGGDLVVGIKDKMLSDLSGENSQPQNQAIKTIKNTTGENNTNSRNILTGIQESINESTTDNIEKSKNSLLINIFINNLGDKRIEEIDGITTINGLGLSDKNKRRLIEAGINDSYIGQFISKLVSKSTDKTAKVSNFLLSLSGNFIVNEESNIGDIQQVSPEQGNEGTVVNEESNIGDIQQISPEQGNENLNDISDEQLIEGLTFRLKKFKKIAQKVEDLETLGLIWDEEENIEKYRSELNVEYSNILFIIGQLRQREANNPKISTILNSTYIFLARYYAGGDGKLDNDHLRDYKISSIMALGILKNLEGCPNFPDLDNPNFEKEIQKFDIDLEYFLDSLENNKDPLIKEAISILKDNRGIGWFDFQEETKDAILDNLGGTIAVVGATATIILASPGVLAGTVVVGGAALTGATINTISRGESDGFGQFAGEAGVLGFQSASAGGLGLLSKFLLAKNFSSITAATIIGSEMAGDVLIVGVAGDALRSEVFDYDYSLCESFESNLAWAPLALIGGVGSIKSTIHRAKIKQAIGDTNGMIKEIKIFNIEISGFKRNLVGKIFNLDVDGIRYNVEIDSTGKIRVNGGEKQLDPKNPGDSKIIEALSIKINDELPSLNSTNPKSGGALNDELPSLNSTNPKLAGALNDELPSLNSTNPKLAGALNDELPFLNSTNPKLAGALKNIEFKKGFESGFNMAKNSFKWIDGKLHYANIGSYLEKIPVIGKYFAKYPKFLKGLQGSAAFLLSDDEIGDIISSLEEDDYISMRNIENIGAIAGNFYGMFKLGIISSFSLHSILGKLGLKEDGSLNQIL